MHGALHGVQNVHQRRVWLGAHAHEKNSGHYAPPQHRLRHRQNLPDKTIQGKQDNLRYAKQSKAKLS